MTTAYTSLLGLALPVTGELDGTWGDTVNNYITQYTDASIAGVQTISGSQTAVTLSTTNGSSLTQAGSVGTTGSAQYQIINCTGNPAGLLTITAPATSKTYVVINATSTSQSVKIVGAGPTTGVTVPSGRKVFVAWNGSDFVSVAGGLVNLATDVTGTLGATNGGTGLTSFTSGGAMYASSGSALTTGTLPATAGGTAQSSYTTGDTLYASASNTLSKLPIGSVGQVLTVSGGVPSWQNPTGTIGPLVYNADSVTSNTTVSSGQNAFSVGPITVQSGYSVTVSSGQRWVVI